MVIFIVYDWTKAGLPAGDLVAVLQLISAMLGALVVAVLIIVETRVETSARLVLAALAAPTRLHTGVLRRGGRLRRRRGRRRCGRSLPRARSLRYWRRSWCWLTKEFNCLIQQLISNYWKSHVYF